MYICIYRERGVCVYLVYLSDGNTQTFGFHPPYLAINYLKPSPSSWVVCLAGGGV